MGKLTEKFLFVHDRIHGSFADDSRLGHLFHCEQLALFPLLYFPNFPKTTAANDVLEVKLVLVDSSIRSVSAESNRNNKMALKLFSNRNVPIKNLPYYINLYLHEQHSRMPISLI